MPRPPRIGLSSQKPVPLRFASYRPPQIVNRSAIVSVANSTTEALRTAFLHRRRSRFSQTPFTGFLAPTSISVDHLAVTLPVPPSINHQYATVNGRRVLSAAGRSYKSLVARQIVVALARSPHRDMLLKTLRAGYLALSIRFFFTTPQRRDVDGGLKIAQDALCEALGTNDNRILEIHLYKALDAEHPRIEVSLCPSTSPYPGRTPRTTPEPAAHR